MFLFKPSIDDSADDYDPAKAKYDAVKDASWKSGQKVPFYALAKTFASIEENRSRLKSIEILGNYFCSVMNLSKDDLVKSIYLCLNKVCPDYEGIELGIGSSILNKALSEATGKNLSQVKKDIANIGDIGSYGEACKSNQKLLIKPKSLNVNAVFDAFKDIATMSGKNVTNSKVEKIKSLITASRPIETRYLLRALTGKMRIGMGEKSLLLSITQAYMVYKNPELKKQLNSDKFKEQVNKNSLLLHTAYCECPNYDKLIPALFEHDFKGLSNACFLTPGIPLKPMLAHPTKGVQEVLQRFDGSKFTCEYKYDGERAQVHYVDSTNVSIYSRNQENNTQKYPDIVKLVPEIIKDSVTSFILDCEAVAYDTATKQILPFQILSTRKRKNVDESEITVRVCLFSFDLLYLNGKSLVTMSLFERRKLLHESFQFTEGKFMLAHSKDLQEIDEIQEFLEESIKNKCEGLMVKTLHDDATYEIAKRSHKWLKLKKDYLDGVGDTLDLVPIGAYIGKGKRTGNYGGFLLACYDDKNDEFQSICKIGTGFTDEDLETLSKALRESVINKPKSYFVVDDSQKPDVWIDPCQVWEVKCADLSISPVHRAAIGILEENKGISLRFPRFIRLRDDKKPEDGTTAFQIAQMYLNQENIKKNPTETAEVKKEEKNDGDEAEEEDAENGFY